MAMKQLSGIDASFLYMETPETPMHVAGLTLYDLPPGFTGSFHEHFKRFFAGRVHLIPIFGKKLAKSVFEIDHPGWVDAEPDLDWHIEGRRLPAPGTQRQLEELVGALHEERLDRTRPLWRFTVIEGLESGQVALYSKVHHAAIDGGAGMVITQALYDLTPEPRKVPPPEPKAPDRVPTIPERAVLGLHDIASNLVRQQLRLFEAAPKAAGQIADLLAPALKGGLSLPQLIAPKTPFNGTIGAARSYVARSVPLSEAKAVAKATGTTINDVVMAISSGALRTYLNRRRALPDAALVAFVPISLREAGNKDLNNQVFGMNCPLATNYGDPMKRLQIINRDSRSSKTVAGGLKELSPRDYTVLGAPMLLPGLMQLYGATRLADVAPNPVNVVISNNAGPPVPLYCAGAKVTALYPVSIPVHGVGVNITVQSYMDALDFGITADAASVPDIERMGEDLVAAHVELRDAALGKPAPSAPPPVTEKPALRVVAEAAPASKAVPAPKAAPKAPVRKPRAKPPAKPADAAAKATSKSAQKEPADKPARKPPAKAASDPAAKAPPRPRSRKPKPPASE